MQHAVFVSARKALRVQDILLRNGFYRAGFGLFRRRGEIQGYRVWYQKAVNDCRQFITEKHMEATQ